jgi:hypothetical protein
MRFERRRLLCICRIFSSHRRRKRHCASSPYHRAPRLRFQGKAVARRVSSRSMWPNFRRRLRTRAISRRLSQCVPRNREHSLHLLGLPLTQCMPIFCLLGRRPRGSKGRKRQSRPKIRPDLFRLRRRLPRMRQPTARAGLMGRSNNYRCVTNQGGIKSPKCLRSGTNGGARHRRRQLGRKMADTDHIELRNACIPAWARAESFRPRLEPKS